MSTPPISTRSPPRLSSSRPTLGTRSPTWPTIPARALVAVHEPGALLAVPTVRRQLRDLAPCLRLALCGVTDDPWSPPSWLFPHQMDAARRLASALAVFGGAFLCDAVGLGKSYVALALATRYRSYAIAIPAALREQWRALGARLGVAPRLVTHEALSRRARLPAATLLVVDEAHRFCDPRTRRYDTLARQLADRHVLLITATPMVNRAQDLVHLARLFLPDHALGALGLPSLEASGTDGDLTGIASALAPLVVARSTETARAPLALPDARGAGVFRVPPVPAACLPCLVRRIDALRFPSFGRSARALLRQHLLARLASSPEACSETLRRHRAYLLRALEAGARGERLARGAARSLFGSDDTGQLTLLLDATENERCVDTRALSAELRRVERLLARFPDSAASPKRAAVRELIRSRGGRKTVLFTAARATARMVADALAWRRVAVVAGRQARIASGAIPVAEAYRLFAPRAQGSRPPDEFLEVDTLVATDVASEGLNLQDADGVIHYDLPWTPLRLGQRVGRVRRLGSAHSQVSVWWFVPPRSIEGRLGLVPRLARKGIRQVRLGVPSTDVVGRLGVRGSLWDRRERLAAGSRGPVEGYAVTQEPGGYLAVVRWTGAGGVLFTCLAPGAPADALALAGRHLTDGSRPEARHAPREAPCDGLPEPLAGALRRRAAQAAAGPLHAAARRLARQIVMRARTAARRRDRRALVALDRALYLLHAGLTTGAERALADVLAFRAPMELDRWVQCTRTRHPRFDHPAVVALIVPDAKRRGSGDAARR